MNITTNAHYLFEKAATIGKRLIRELKSENIEGRKSVKGGVNFDRGYEGYTYISLRHI